MYSIASSFPQFGHGSSFVIHLKNLANIFAINTIPYKLRTNALSENTTKNASSLKSPSNGLHSKTSNAIQKIFTLTEGLFRNFITPVSIYTIISGGKNIELKMISDISKNFRVLLFVFNCFFSFSTSLLNFSFSELSPSSFSSSSSTSSSASKSSSSSESSSTSSRSSSSFAFFMSEISDFNSLMSFNNSSCDDSAFFSSTGVSLLVFLRLLRKQ